VHFQQQDKLTKPIPEPVTVTGTILQLPDVDTRRTRFLFATDNSSYQRLLLNWYWSDPTQTQALKSGQKWQLQVSLKPPHGLANPAGFDYARWLFRQGIDAMGTVRGGNLLTPSSTFSWNHIHHYREQVRDWLNQHFTQQPARGLVKALTIGDKTDIPRPQQELLQASGAAHLLAISGLHIGIVAALGYRLGWLLFYLWRPRRLLRPHIQSLCAFSCAFLYASLAGFSIPTLRALLMLSVYLVAIYKRRSVYSWDIYGMALFLVLAYDPLSVLDMGFWLSFGAVLVLLMAFRGRKQQKPWLAFIRAQWMILIGLLPFSVLLFGGVQGFAPIMNLLLIPLMSLLLMPLLFVLLMTGLFSITPGLLVTAIELCIDVFYHIMQDLSQWHWLKWSFSIQPGWALLCLVLFAVVMLMPAVVPKRWLAIPLLLPSFFPQLKRPPEGSVDITVLDVGQGLSILVQTQRHQLLYDTGAASLSGFTMVNAAVIPVLKKHNIQKLDKVILSHADNDHAGGYAELRRQVTIDQTLAGFHAGLPYCLKGHRWMWDGVQFEIFSPYNLHPYLGNNSSCVLRISTAEHSMLITGDIESPVEYRLVQQAAKWLQSDILVVPHHGSRTSSSSTFLEAVHPRLAVNSSAYTNHFGHPASDIKRRYQQHGIPFIDTQTHGMIHIRLSQNSHIDCHLESRKRIWRVAERQPQKSPHNCGLLTNVLNSD